MHVKNYVLITAARNEAKYIELTLQSVVAQTVQPQKWVIVSDGSTDETDDIVKRYIKDNDFIDFIRIDEQERDRNFASKVFAIREGYRRLQDSNYGYIGHLDADISFDKEYYDNILKKFEQKPTLGISGGLIFENYNGKFESRPLNTVRSVAGGIQLFRRECYEQIGGLLPLKVGGEDWYAEVTARMNGWVVESYEDLIVYHHKRSTEARSIIRESYRHGIMDYSLGSHPIFELLKCARRIKEKPFFIAACIRICSFAWSYTRVKERLVTEEFINYLRKEQMQLLKTRIFHNK